MRTTDYTDVRPANALRALVGALALSSAACGAPEETRHDPIPQPLAVTPEVRALSPKVEGDLAAHLVADEVEAHLDALETCYADALGRNPGASGRLIIQFIIGADGDVERATVAASQVPDAKVGPCFTRALARLHFVEPADNGRVDVMYPFMLAPKIVGAAPVAAHNRS